MIHPNNNDENNDVTIAGTDLFADSESFLNELTDSELVQVRGGVGVNLGAGGFGAELEVEPPPSQLSVLLCN